MPGPLLRSKWYAGKVRGCIPAAGWNRAATPPPAHSAPKANDGDPATYWQSAENKPDAWAQMTAATGDPRYLQRMNATARKYSGAAATAG